MSTSTVVQIIGLLLVAAGLAIVWTPWALVGVGAAAVILPELAALAAVRASRPKPGARP